MKFIIRSTKDPKKKIPFVNWKVCKAHLSAASLTGVLLSFKHSASAEPIIGT